MSDHSAFVLSSEKIIHLKHEFFYLLLTRKKNHVKQFENVFNPRLFKQLRNLSAFKTLVAIVLNTQVRNLRMLSVGVNRPSREGDGSERVIE